MPSDKKRSKLVLRDADPSVQPQSLAVYAVDASGKTLATASVNDKGEFELAPDVLSKAAEVIVARAVEGKAEPDLANGASFHPFEVAEQIKKGLDLELGPVQLGIIFPPLRCAEGSVRHCFPFLLAVQNLAVEMKQAALPRFGEIAEGVAASIASSIPSITFPTRCRPVCDGVVEVYRRTCCCTPIIVFDPRIQDLLDRLREIVREVPPIRWPIPGPDPGPIERAVIEHGTIDPVKLNAAADLKALQTLAPAEQVQYINIRPYLLHLCCHCGTLQKVGQGYLRPDGTFRICFFELRPRFFCWNTYAFIVKQVINGATVTIYDGVASNTWFSDISDVDLVTYNPRTINCARPDPGVNPNAVFLQDVGLTPAWRLGKPTHGIDPAAASFAGVFTDGLINPGGVGGSPANRNLGGTLNLRLFISESLRGTAKYFRLSYVPASNLGATPVVLPPMTWNYVEIVGTSVNVIPHALGGVGNLSEIPYWADHAWMSGQYHGQMNTTGLSHGAYVLIVELFDGSANLIPSGINYVNWNTPTTTDNVPYSKLLVPLYVDNRSCYGDIKDVTAPANTSSDPDCLYLIGSAGQTIRINYKAGFPDPNFLLGYSLWTHRGLSGPNVTQVSSTTNSALPWDHVDPTIGSLLGTHTRCSFAANLHVQAKTTDGIYSLTADAWDQVAFSIEQA